MSESAALENDPPAPPMSGGNRLSPGDLLYFLAFVLSLLGVLSAVEIIADAANAAIVAFLVIEFRRAPPIPRVVGAILIIIGAAGAYSADVTFASIWTGIEQTQKFLVLFGAVAFLQVPAGESPSLGAIQEMVKTQPPGKRYTYLAAAAHFLGIAFNIAGISLMTDMISRQQEKLLKQRLARAMLHGFATGTCWSPFFVGAAVILAAWPEVTWLDIAPYGIALGFTLTSVSWAMDRFGARKAPAGTDAPEATTVSAQAWARTALVLGCLFTGTMTLVEALGLSIPIALGVVGPPLALIWRATMIAPSARLRQSGLFVRGTIARLSNLRGEILVFAGANIMGAGIAAAIDPGTVTGLLAAADLGTDAKIFLLAMGFVICGALAIHPVIVVVLIAHLLPAEALGIPPQVLVLMLMALWGLSTNVSPVSATVLFVSRVANENNLTIAWRWNAPFSFTGAALLAAVVIAGRHLGLYG